jgi:hypothetical protein
VEMCPRHVVAATLPFQTSTLPSSSRAKLVVRHLGYDSAADLSHSIAGLSRLSKPKECAEANHRSAGYYSLISSESNT